MAKKNVNTRAQAGTGDRLDSLDLQHLSGSARKQLAMLRAARDKELRAKAGSYIKATQQLLYELEQLLVAGRVTEALKLVRNSRKSGDA
jgi:hypothetical protein